MQGLTAHQPREHLFGASPHVPWSYRAIKTRPLQECTQSPSLNHHDERSESPSTGQRVFVHFICCHQHREEVSS